MRRQWPAMPLKHLTETVLIAILAAVTIVTGFLVATLPHLPQGLLPAAMLLVLTLLYLVAIYPLLKSNRADNAFRLLHAAPAAIVAVWFAVEIAGLRFPALLLLSRVWTWGFGLFGVLLTFVLLAAFVLRVIRRRTPRLSILAALILPFALIGLFSERRNGWHSALSASLWKNVWSTVAWSENPADMPPPPGPGVANSSSAKSMIAAGGGQSSSRPGRLPTSGPEHVAAIVTLFLTAYCAVVHERARRRAVA